MNKFSKIAMEKVADEFSMLDKLYEDSFDDLMTDSVSGTKQSTKKLVDTAAEVIRKGKEGLSGLGRSAAHIADGIVGKSSALAEAIAKAGGKKGKILLGILGTLGLGTGAGVGVHHVLSENSALGALKGLAQEHPWHAAGAGAAAAGAAGGSAMGIRKLLGRAKAKKAAKPAAKGLAKLKELLKAVRH